MSASASSPPVARKLTKAEAISAKDEMKKLLERQAELARRLHFDNAVGLESTMERSLKENLKLVHDSEAGDLGGPLSAFVGMDEKDYMYEADDLMDEEFYDSGVQRPQDPTQLSADEQMAMTQADALQLVQEWIVAFGEMDVKFTKRALLAYELKQVYIKKRAEVGEDISIE
jgi:hypothetical protein